MRANVPARTRSLAVVAVVVATRECSDGTSNLVSRGAALGAPNDCDAVVYLAQSDVQSQGPGCTERTLASRDARREDPA